jgi:DNA-binding response OmpR family regulator
MPGPLWKSAGYIFISAGSIRQAIDHFKAGDFDLVLLGHSIPAESRERLTYLIRATGSRVPVVCIAGSSEPDDSFADATFRNDSSELLTGMEKLLATKATVRTALAVLCGNPA